LPGQLEGKLVEVLRVLGLLSIRVVLLWGNVFFCDVILGMGVWLGVEVLVKHYIDSLRVGLVYI
jgi:hypothetical protein